MEIQDYLDRVAGKYGTGDATEHSYRSALEALFEGIAPGLNAINEPKRVAVGAPDFVVRLGGIDIGHCEAKDLHIDLTRLKDANADQKRRYLKALPNLIYTNGLDFEFYKSGEKIRSIRIATLSGGRIAAHPDAFDTLTNQLRAFAAERPQTIATAKKLAEMMAGKAVLIKDIMGNALRVDAHLQTELTGQFAAFKAHLIHDIDADEFADVYAETIAYGLFAARLHDQTIDTFDRREALELLPKSNPFLRSLFGYIAGVDLDDRIAWVIDELCDVLRACNVHELMADFGKWTARNDPFLHFYETFLAEYNPAKRKARGVWYTPEPVVNFIVRAVDDVLKTEFGLPMGLADTSKVSVDWDTSQTDAKGNRTSIKKDVHRVQILDPATGTGTFLAEAIKQIAAKVKGVAPGMWSNYVEQDLIPRIHGFELLMASYAMCHMKIDMMLADLGYVPSAAPPRLSVYLTNSLEEGDVADQQLPFARWLSEEAKGANTIKRDTPIMCVIGNPPYSGISQNNGEWISNLIEDYKYVDGVHFGERKHWLQDDYVKFIRFAEHMIDKNGEGVLGFITNHGYLDNPTFRGMRYRLLETFDKIYVFDLHGNANKKEVCPDGSPDKNVFDIKQGVAVVIAVKLGSSSEGRVRGRRNDISAAAVMHTEIWGTRESKYESLWDKSIYSGNWAPIPNNTPFYLFAPRDGDLTERYEVGFSITDLMQVNVTGMVTARDALVIDFDRVAEIRKLKAFRDPKKSDTQVRNEFFPGKKSGKYLPGDSRGWSLSKAREALQGVDLDSDMKLVSYRPFDTRTIYYRPEMVDWGREKVAYNFYASDNLGLATARSNKNPEVDHFLASRFMTEAKFAESSTQSAIFPLYLFPEPGSLKTERRINFDPKIYATIREAAGLNKGPLRQIHDKRDGGKPDELRVFDYIYGVLHSPEYRATYAQFLKIDFPRIPYPVSPKVFADVAAKGGQLRHLHLMDDAAVGEAPYAFQGNGSGEVVKPEYEAGRVYINPGQWFDNVPAVAWGFHIGGYQPAQKWLKDRKGRALSFDDVRHYQKIVKILVETDRIMKEIELPL